MLDLSYVLLVIFILMTTASVQGIKVNLPKASNTPSLAKPATRAITITETGALYLDAYPMATLADLEARLLQFKAGTPEFPIVVKGDSAVQYEKVVEARTQPDRSRHAAAGQVKPEDSFMRRHGRTVALVLLVLLLIAGAVWLYGVMSQPTEPTKKRTVQEISLIKPPPPPPPPKTPPPPPPPEQKQEKIDVPKPDTPPRSEQHTFVFLTNRRSPGP
eukprot:gene24601-45396_t